MERLFKLNPKMRPITFVVAKEHMPQSIMNKDDSEKKTGEIKIKLVSSNTCTINIPALKDQKVEDIKDMESRKGRFGWVTIKDSCYLPFIYRNGQKYCAVRMAEKTAIASFLACIDLDIFYPCINIPSYYITDAEMRVLNEINSVHCDYQFGRILFSLRDIVVLLQDVVEFYNFLLTCQKGLYKSKTPNANNNLSSKCGFISINKTSVVPYVVSNGEQLVPLFYFEGAEHLQLQAKVLKGWDLSYLKFCYTIQGIREEFVKQESCVVISMSNIKESFPPDTVFQDYWPNAISQKQTGSKNATKTWYRQPTLNSLNCNYFIQSPVTKAS